jgi:hypothetical protein
VRPLTLLVCVVCAFGFAGCGGSSSSPRSTAPADTKNDPGPNPTSGDPGPNNTANGPVTLQGTLIGRAACIELDGSAANQPKSRFQLVFAVEKTRRSGSSVVISGTDGDRTVGPKDTIYVAGRPGSGSGPCGQKFNVEKVVAVTPSG